jgi:hypothetical protein
MQTRLITTYEEAKALKDAGWPQDIYAAYYSPSQTRTREHPSESCLHTACVPDDAIAVPRLDELLAFLWDRGLHFGRGNIAVSSGYEEITPLKFWDITSADYELLEQLSGEYDAGEEPIKAAVSAVLFVLNNAKAQPDTASQQ